MSKLTKKEKLALSDFKKRVKEIFKKDKPHLILFGSKVRGDAHPDSDIDVLVILRELSVKKRCVISDLATDIFLKEQIDISPHIYSQKEYQKLTSLQTPFMFFIKQEGLTL